MRHDVGGNSSLFVDNMQHVDRGRPSTMKCKEIRVSQSVAKQEAEKIGFMRLRRESVHACIR